VADRLLPLSPVSHPGGRSAMTCQYRCGNACFHPVPNTSENAYFGDIVAEVISRRGMLRTGALGALVVGAGVAGVAAPPEAAAGAAHPHGRRSRLRFPPVAPNREDRVVTAPGYRHSVVVRWGDPVLPGAPAFDFDNQTAAAQAEQFGYNCDFVAFFPLGRNRALLWANHEYTNEELMFRGYTGGATATVEQIKIAMAAHGGSVVEIERAGRTGQWKLVTRGKRRFNRRITADTPMILTGPAAGHPLLRTAEDPAGRKVRGMLNNCAGGVSPWGTILTAEENFNQYFVATSALPKPIADPLARYGVPSRLETNRRWDRVEERFDLSKHPNEANRFGWIVEIDPYDPHAAPRKRTHLGRFKHEAANSTLSEDGRPVIYMGDDERFDYIYKFVSSGRYRPGSRKHNMSLLDDGTLYVARFTGDSPGEIDGTGELPADGEFDGTGEWIPLVSGNKSHVPGMTAAEVLIHTRLAGDHPEIRATKMDRPEDMERNPVTGAIYVALTNNTDRKLPTPGTFDPRAADEANPRAANRHGHVLEIVEDGNDAAATKFRWSVPLVCGDPSDPTTYFAGFDKSKVSPISCPDNVAFDGDGNLWISTDGNALGSNDGLFAMPVQGPERGHVRQFLTVPVAAETCGPWITRDQKTVFVAVQHPGEGTGASPDRPLSRWPDGGQPRPSVVSVWHAQGRDVGE
jgi:uncharacterized protein